MHSTLSFALEYHHSQIDNAAAAYKPRHVSFCGGQGQTPVELQHIYVSDGRQVEKHFKELADGALTDIDDAIEPAFPELDAPALAATSLGSGAHAFRS